MIEKGMIIWLYGLSASGKTTLADMLSDYLINERGMKNVARLDGDIVRKELTNDLGFSLDDRFEHIRRVAFVANLLSDYGVHVICSFITPLKAMRIYLREYIGDTLIPIEIRSSLQTCLKRDPKGLYKKAMNGIIKDFTGLTSPYEVSMGDFHDLYVNTDNLNEDTSFHDLLNLLNDLGWKI